MTRSTLYNALLARFYCAIECANESSLLAFIVLHIANAASPQNRTSENTRLQVDGQGVNNYSYRLMR